MVQLVPLTSTVTQSSSRSVEEAIYPNMCGSVRAYQVGRIDAFEAYHDGEVTKATIEGVYVAGVSLTHGIPRQHFWTFAAGS